MFRDVACFILTAAPVKRAGPPLLVREKLYSRLSLDDGAAHVSQLAFSRLRLLLARARQPERRWVLGVGAAICCISTRALHAVHYRLSSFSFSFSFHRKPSLSVS